MTRSRQIALVVVTFLFSLAFGVHKTPAATKQIVGYAAVTARVMPLWLATEQGFFTKYGIDVEPVFIRGAPT
jgi:ABC-type nitrate/sulfonate/bicarbonate transport system substrate-binding protein